MANGNAKVFQDINIFKYFYFLLLEDYSVLFYVLLAYLCGSPNKLVDGYDILSSDTFREQQSNYWYLALETRLKVVKTTKVTRLGFASLDHFLHKL